MRTVWQGVLVAALAAAVTATLHGVMPLPIIAPASDDEVRAGTLGKPLREFNYRRIGRYPELMVKEL